MALRNLTPSEWIGLLTKGLGQFVLPPVVAGVMAYVAVSGSPGDKIWAAAIASLVLAALVPSLSFLGNKIAMGGTLHSALKYALKTLVKRLQSALDASLAANPARPDPRVPHFRVTVFVPEKRLGDSEKKLYPKLRLSSGPNAKIVTADDNEFKKTKPFEKNDAFIGTCWSSRQERCETFFPYSECPGENDAAKLSTWEAQWVGAPSPRNWSPYMRQVRSLWAFPVLDETATACIAVFSVDSTLSDAFRVLEEYDEQLEKCKAPLLSNIYLREMVAVYVQGLILTAIGRRRIEMIRTLFSRRQKQVAAAGRSPDAGSSSTSSPLLPSQR